MADRDQQRWTEGELGEQRRRLEKVFVEGIVLPARAPVFLSDEQLARVHRVFARGGWTYGREEAEYLARLRAGDRRGEPLPAAPEIREPYIAGLGEDFEVRVAGSGNYARVIILFSHERWPGVRFGHRFPPPDPIDDHESIILAAYIGSGGLDDLMSQRPQPDGDGIIWTDLA